MDSSIASASPRVFLAQDQTPVVAPAKPESSPPEAIQKDRKKLAGLFWISMILLVLLFAVVAISRFSLRYKQFLVRGNRPGPTPCDDVWAQHKDPREMKTLADPDFDKDKT